MKTSALATIAGPLAANGVRTAHGVGRTRNIAMLQSQHHVERVVVMAIILVSCVLIVISCVQ